MTASQLHEFSSEWAKWRDDPDRFNTVALRRPPYWSKQQEICRSVVKFRTTVVYSGNATGKGFLLAGIIPWWLYTRPGSLVICTAASQTSIGSIIFKELRRAIESSFLPQPRISRGIKASPAVIEIAPGWHGLGYSTTSVERASGQHARHLLVVVDEASGVEPEIWQALDSLKYARLLAVGNPIRAEGVFVDLIRQSEADSRDGVPSSRAVNAIQIPSTMSPDADKEESEYGLADRTFLESSYRRYGGEHSFWCNSHIHAIIPTISAQRLIPDSWLDYATSIQRQNQPPNHPVHRTRRIAVDLSEGVGRDDTCILLKDAYGLIHCDARNSLPLVEAAEATAAVARRWNVPPERISYDGLGIGRDFPKYLAKAGLVGCIRYVAGGTPQEPKRFFNLRTESAWKLHDRLNPDRHTDDRYPLTSRQPPFSIPPQVWWSLMRADLAALTYELVGERQVKLIKKEDLMEVLGRSPDRGDALIQAFAFD
jgi:phage terminase large subunit